MTGGGRRVVMLAVIGALLVMLAAGGLALLERQPVGLASTLRLQAFVASLCVAGALWLLAVAIVRRGRLPPRAIWLVLAVAVAMRLLTLFAPPVLSSDIYRYVWDGRVQLAGINPYRDVPAADELAPLRDATVYPQINRADYARTIYPPGAQAIFALAAMATPGVFGMKLMIAIFDAVAIGALIVLLRIAGRDPAELLIYAWLPLPVWEFAGNAHIDGAAAGLVTLALLAAVRRRWVWTGVLLGFATLTKFLPVVVLPALWRPWNRWMPAAFALTVVALYLCYATAGWKVLGFLSGYASEEGFQSGSGIFLLQVLSTAVALPAWAPKLYVALVLVVLGGIAVRFAFATPLPMADGPRVLCQARQAAILAAVLLIALSPHYPWYFGWLAPLACLAPLPGVLWLLAAAPLLAHGALQYLAVPAAVYGPAIALAALGAVRALPTSPQIVRSTP
ncbi:MAG: glycosyltransferase family 87 protein [Acetobacteraceae bacterium]